MDRLTGFADRHPNWAALLCGATLLLAGAARAADSEAGSFSGVTEQRPQECPIKAQSTAMARAMARICNAERVLLGLVSGHERKTLSLSAA